MSSSQSSENDSIQASIHGKWKIISSTFPFCYCSLPLPLLTCSLPLSLPSPSELAQSLLSRDPTKFNSCINHNFESHATYKGHGLVLNGVHIIKEAAALLNSLDGGKAALVKKEDVKWDSS